MKYFTKKSYASESFMERLRQYFDGELTHDEKAKLFLEIEENPKKRAIYRNQKHLREDLANLQPFQPPSRLWHAIEQNIHETKPVSAWYPYFNVSLDQIAFAKSVCMFLAITTISFALYTTYPKEPAYKVITINEVQVYQVEADAYLAHHVVTAEPLDYQESLVAYYYGFPE